MFMRYVKLAVQFLVYIAQIALRHKSILIPDPPYLDACRIASKLGNTLRRMYAIEGARYVL